MYFLFFLSRDYYIAKLGIRRNIQTTVSYIVAVTAKSMRIYKTSKKSKNFQWISFKKNKNLQQLWLSI